MNSLIRSYGRGIVLKRHRSVLVQRIGMMATAAILALVHSACTEVLSDPQEAAYPRFALTGEVPDRVTAFDLTIDADDISPVVERVYVDEGPHAFHVPLGTGRTIELLSVGDVYSGRITRDFNNGGEYEVTVPLVAGPVVPDPLNERVVQIRDMTGEGWRSLGNDGDVGTGMEDFTPFGAEYDHSGRLWIVDQHNQRDPAVAFDSLSASNPDVIVTDWSDVGLEARSLAIDAQRQQVYFWGWPDPGWGLYVADMSGNQVQELPIVNDQTLSDALDVDNIEAISGIAVDSDGATIAVVPHGGGESGGLFVINPDEQDEDAIETVLPSDQILLWSELDYYADVTIRGDHAYVTNAAAQDNHVIRIDTDLDPDSIVPVQPPDGEAFLGPRRFAATRDDMGPIIVTDQDPDDPEAPGRLVAFENVDGEGWTTLEHNPDDPDDEFAFFEFGGE